MSGVVRQVSHVEAPAAGWAIFSNLDFSSNSKFRFQIKLAAERIILRRSRIARTLAEQRWAGLHTSTKASSGVCGMSESKRSWRS